MAQYEVWEKEYKSPQLVTGGEKPQNDVLRFLKYFKRNYKKGLSGLEILDLGCGTGKNANYLASLGNNVSGMEISTTAIELAKERAKQTNLIVNYKKRSIGKRYPFCDNSFDLALDITSSNSLTEHERKIYLQETHRVLKSGAYFFVRALCKEGDKNAKNLLKNSPGKENDTYIINELGLIERVFLLADFRKMYGKYFKIEKIFTRSGYTRFQGQSYKRVYLLAYLRKI